MIVGVKLVVIIAWGEMSPNLLSILHGHKFKLTPGPSAKYRPFRAVFDYLFSLFFNCALNQSDNFAGSVAPLPYVANR